MIIALNAALRRHGNRIRAAVAVLALTGALVVAHGALGATHMASPALPAQMGMEMHGHPAAPADDGAMSDMVAMCLAIAETAAIGFGLLAVVAALRLALAFVRARIPDARVAGRPRPARARAARAGPAVLQVFLR